MSARQDRVDRTHDALIASARRAFLRGERVSIASCARDCGIGVATAYRYYRDPQELLMLGMAPELGIVAAARQWWEDRIPHDAAEAALIEAVAAANDGYGATCREAAE